MVILEQLQPKVLNFQHPHQVLNIQHSNLFFILFPFVLFFFYQAFNVFIEIIITKILNWMEFSLLESSFTIGIINLPQILLIKNVQEQNHILLSSSTMNLIIKIIDKMLNF